MPGGIGDAILVQHHFGATGPCPPYHAVGIGVEGTADEVEQVWGDWRIRENPLQVEDFDDSARDDLVWLEPLVEAIEYPWA